MKINMLDLKTQYEAIKPRIDAAVMEVLGSSAFILGPAVDRFEKGMAAYLGVKHAIACASGSDALLLCNMALDAGRKDEIITTPYTFFATISSITRLGAFPTLIDIEPKTFNISPSELENFLKKNATYNKKTGKTVNKKTKRNIKAIMPVHLYGQACDMDALMKISAAYGIPVIEDAAQSIGATYKGKMTGGIGLAGAFSFYPTKNLGAYGDGGMVTTNDDAFANKVKMLRLHGSKVKYYHKLVGLNSRLDSLQAAILNVKLEILGDYLNGRIAAADRYDAMFAAKAGSSVKVPVRAKDRNHTFHQYVVRVQRRDLLREYLKNNGVGSEIYYPLCLHEQECFNYLKYKKGSFPASEKASMETLALPMYPELNSEQQEYIVDKVAEFYSK